MPASLRRRVARLLLACVAVSLVAAFSGLVGYELGGRRGFVDGFNRSSYGGNAVEAMTAISAIKLIDEGKPGEARALLDSAPNFAMISYPSYAAMDLSRFNTLDDQSDIPTWYRRVAVFRSEHPTSSPDPDLRDMVQETAEALLRDVPAPPPSESCEVASRRLVSS